MALDLLGANGKLSVFVVISLVVMVGRFGLAKVSSLCAAETILEKQTMELLLQN